MGKYMIFRWLWPALVVLLLVGSALQFHKYYSLRIEADANIQQRIFNAAVAEAAEFQEFLTVAERAASTLADSIGSGSLPRAEYKEKLQSLITSDPLYFGGAIAFAPYEYDTNVRLYAPYYVIKNGRGHFMQIERSYDYTQPENTWFTSAMSEGSRWSEPYFDESVGDILMTTYSAVIYRQTDDGKQLPIGVVTIDIGISDIGRLVNEIKYDNSGLVEVVTTEGAYLYSPEKDRVLREESILDARRWSSPDDMANTRQRLSSGQAGVIALEGRVDDSAALLSVAPIGETGWRLVSTFEEAELTLRTVPMRKQLMLGILLLVSGLALLLFAGNFFKPGEGVFAWPTVLLVTGVLAGGTYAVWQVTNTYDSSRHRQHDQVTSQRQVLAMQGDVADHARQKGTMAPVFIPTGIYVDSLRFTSPNDILVIGSVWQRFDIERHRKVSRGVLFPGAETVRFSEPAVIRSGNSEVVRWQFQGSLRLSLDYLRFPLIRDSISLAVKPLDSVGNVMLVPDLGAYPQLTASTLPGIGPDTYLAGWTMERSFFELRDWQQRTTFGLNDNFRIQNIPEYFWTLEIEKVFIHAFISFLTPLIIAFVMVFILLLLSTRDKAKLDLMRTGIGFDIGVSASIFFVVVLSHISLRQKIISVEVFYLEYFYLLMYCNMLWVCFHSILNTTNPKLLHHLTLGVTAKKTYFPVSFAIIFVFTWLAFYA